MPQYLMFLLAFKVFSLIQWRKFNFSLSFIPRFFQQLVCATRASLKQIVGWCIFFVFGEKILFCACLVRSGLKDIFNCYTHSLILMTSSFIILAESKGLLTVENSVVSSVNNSTTNPKFLGRSFMYNTKSKGPSIQSCGTLGKTGDQLED